MGNFRPISPDPASEPTFRELSNIWLDAARGAVVECSHRHYRGQVRRLCDRLGGLTLEQLTPMVAIRYCQDRVAEGVQPSTALGEWQRLRQITGWCAEMGLGVDPLATMKRAPLRKERDPARKARPMTSDEWMRLARAVRSDDRSKLVPQYPAFLMLYDLAPRIGALMSLQWWGVDLGPNPSVRWKLSAVKNRNSARALPLSPRLVEELRGLLAVHEKMLGRPIEPNDLVFLSPNGKPLHERNFRTYFDTALERAGIEKHGERGSLRPHAMRQTLATRAALAGIALPVTARLLGHAASSKVTADVYTDIEVNDLRDTLAARLWSYTDSNPPPWLAATSIVTGSAGEIAESAVADTPAPSSDSPPIIAARHPALLSGELLVTPDAMGREEYVRFLGAVARGEAVRIIAGGSR